MERLPATRSAKKPMTPAVAGVGLGVALLAGMFVLGWNLKLVVVAFLAIGFGLLAFVLRVLKSHPGAQAIERREAEMQRDAEDRARFAEVRKLFLNHDSPDAKADARKALDQLDAVQALYKTFSKALEQKFQSGEVTEARYRGTGEQVYHGVVQNLRVLGEVLRNLDDLRKAKGAKAGEPLPPEESFAAKRREIIDGNAAALASLAKVNAALTEVRTERTELRVDLTHSMAELQELANRAHLYSNDR